MIADADRVEIPNINRLAYLSLLVGLGDFHAGEKVRDTTYAARQILDEEERAERSRGRVVLPSGYRSRDDESGEIWVLLGREFVDMTNDQVLEYAMGYSDKHYVHTPVSEEWNPNRSYSPTGETIRYAPHVKRTRTRVLVVQVVAVDC